MTALADSRPDDADRVYAVGVVVLVRNEELLLPRCLAALQTAVARALLNRPARLVQVVVVLDACLDRTSDVVTPSLFVGAVRVQLGWVGPRGPWAWPT